MREGALGVGKRVQMCFLVKHSCTCKVQLCFTREQKYSCTLRESNKKVHLYVLVKYSCTTRKHSCTCKVQLYWSEVPSTAVLHVHAGSSTMCPGAGSRLELRR